MPARAFNRVKSDGYSSAVLITDGLPDDESQALNSARGLSMEIFYVGPAPKPGFLDELAAIAGGQAHAADLGRTGRQELETRFGGYLLEQPCQSSDLRSGAEVAGSGGQQSQP
jgi:hypothetical protein